MSVMAQRIGESAIHLKAKFDRDPAFAQYENGPCPASPFWDLRETGMRTDTGTDRRRSRFIRDLAARKLDFARSQEIGLKTTK
jgi:hypothetical protein